MSRLVDRFGRTGAAAVTSLIWAVPMAAWAGSADLAPYDKTAYPSIALAVGLVMLAAWLVLLARISRAPSPPGAHRLDLGRMTGAEKGWNLALAGFATGLIGWLNAAATVDWGPLGAALKTGSPGPWIFTFGLGLFALVMLGGIWLSWRRATAAYRRRKLSP